MTEHSKLLSNTLASLAQGILVITLGAAAFKGNLSAVEELIAIAYIVLAFFLYAIAHAAIEESLWKP